MRLCVNCDNVSAVQEHVLFVFHCSRYSEQRSWLHARTFSLSAGVVNLSALSRQDCLSYMLGNIPEHLQLDTVPSDAQMTLLLQGVDLIMQEHKRLTRYWSERRILIDWCFSNSARDGPAHLLVKMFVSSGLVGSSVVPVSLSSASDQQR